VCVEVFTAPGPRSLARRIAGQSMVLLQNDGLLPLKKSTGMLAVIGPNADEWRVLLGDYSFIPQLEYALTVLPPDSFAGRGRCPSGCRAGRPHPDRLAGHPGRRAHAGNLLRTGL